MSQAALAVEQYTEPLATPEGNNPLEPRWYIQVCDREALVESFQFGFPRAKYAEFGVAQVFHVPQEYHTTDDNPTLPKETMVQHTALDVEYRLKERFAGCDDWGNPTLGKRDKGLQIGFVGEKDVAKMKVISDTLLPTLPRLIEISAEYGHGEYQGCEGKDDLDFGERQACPTCWFEWINSDLCTAYMEAVSQTGRQVTDAQGKMWTVTPTMSELETARQIVANALRGGIRYLTTEWTTIASEIEKGTRDGLDMNGHQNTIRQDVHRIKPQDREMQLIKEATKGGGSDNSELLTMLAKSQMETNALLRQVVSKDIPGAPPSDTPVSDPFAVNSIVLCDGEPGVITEAKTAGWYVVALDNGDTKTVRKANLQAQEA